MGRLGQRRHRYHSDKFAKPIDKADRVTLTISIPGAEAFTGRLNVLPGDVNGDGMVSSADLSVIRNQWRGKRLATIYGEIIGNGTVNSADYSAARKFVGMRLPKLTAKAMKAVVMSDRVRHPAIKKFQFRWTGRDNCQDSSETDAAPIRGARKRDDKTLEGFRGGAVPRPGR